MGELLEKKAKSRDNVDHEYHLWPGKARGERGTGQIRASSASGQAISGHSERIVDHNLDAKIVQELHIACRHCSCDLRSTPNGKAWHQSCMIEECLPSGEGRERDGSRLNVVDAARLGGEVGGPDNGILRSTTVACSRWWPSFILPVAFDGLTRRNVSDRTPLTSLTAPLSDSAGSTDRLQI
jgi:hypothetical protein